MKVARRVRRGVSGDVPDGQRARHLPYQLRKSVKESGEFTPEQLAEYDHWTMLLPEEY